MHDMENDNEDKIQELISAIALADSEIKEWHDCKHKMNMSLAGLLDHTKEGAHTHHFKNYNITITTGWNYKLDVAKYSDFIDAINPKFNPVRVITKYELNKKRIKDCELYGSNDDLNMLSEFCIKTPKKLHVKISVNASNEGVEHE